jgi:hypothetical protein
MLATNERALSMTPAAPIMRETCRQVSMLAAKWNFLSKLW